MTDQTNQVSLEEVRVRFLDAEARLSEAATAVGAIQEAAERLGAAREGLGAAGLRLGELKGYEDGPGLGRLAAGFELLARDGAERAEYGFDHGLALLADLVLWVERRRPCHSFKGDSDVGQLP